jgi:hypothetical protein
MIPKPIDDILLSDLQALIGIVREGKTIEFKQQMPGKAASDLVPFLAGVSSLANTSGGDFVIGIVEKDGLAQGAPGIAIASPDDELLRLEQHLANGLEPRLPRVNMRLVACDPGKYAVIIRVAHSWIGPHRVKSNDKFYGRNSAGRYPLDVGELRSAFVLSQSITERIRAFRTERLLKVIAGETPIPLAQGGKIVLHVVPLPAFADNRLVDVVSSVVRGTAVPLPLTGMRGLSCAAYVTT